MNANSSKLLEVKNLRTYFFLNEGTVRAVDGVNFEIDKNRVLGVVGESGCGKSVTSRSIIRIVSEPGRVVEGDILYHKPVNGGSSETINLAMLDPRGPEVRDLRGGEIAMVFQEPMTSLSPVHTIGNQIGESAMIHLGMNNKEARERTLEMLKMVDMPKPSQAVDSYPHELSGGMRQRAMIAMALTCRPTLLIADEPTTALDVTTEAQILDLLRQLQEQIGMAIMYITHDLGVIAEMAEQVIVMYLGKVVENTDVDSLFYDAKHPYTRALLKSIPRLGEKIDRLEVIKGMVPDPYSIPSGCSFHPRCPSYIRGTCEKEEPPVIEVEPGHLVKCFLYV
jgi:peptide/nickel transport system ATP-binding protein